MREIVWRRPVASVRSPSGIRVNSATVVYRRCGSAGTRSSGLLSAGRTWSLTCTSRVFVLEMGSFSAAPDRQVLGVLAVKVRDGIGPAAPKPSDVELLGWDPATPDYSQLVMKLAGQYRAR